MNLRYRLWKFIAGPRTLSRDLITAFLVLFLGLLSVVGVLTYSFEVSSERKKRHAFARDMIVTLIELARPPLGAEDTQKLTTVADAHLKSEHILEIVFRQGGEEFRYKKTMPAEGSRFVLQESFELAGGGRATVEVTFWSEPIRELRGRLLLYGLFVGVVAFLLAVPGAVYLMRRLLARPLYRIQEGIREYSNGNYNYRLRLGRQRDMAALIRGVNEMARNIQLREVELRNSEAKYRSLVESARSMTFSLDADGVVLTMNRAANELLGFRPEQMIGRPLSEFLYSAGEHSDLIRAEFYRQRFVELKEQKGNVRFKIELETAQQEPRDLEISLERVDVEGDENGIILGRAYSIPEDSLTKYLVSEVRSYQIGNFLTAAEQLTSRITVGLDRYCLAEDAIPIRMGIREMLVNAIEHGNLNITFDEKTDATRGEDYFDLLATRQKDPRYRDRRVVLRYSLNADRVRVVITDEGEGFDPELRGKDPGKEIYHGRGILLARSIFDLVQYNERGNRVLLVKYFRDTPRTDD